MRSGGGLAAILGLKIALAMPTKKILFQLLILPVIDNTATAESVWASNRNAPWLTPARMIVCHEIYF